MNERGGGFNPLAGIRCFLTHILELSYFEPGYGFQSPSGDSLFSDVVTASDHGLSVSSFNPLAGIRCFLTNEKEQSNLENFYAVSIP